MDTDEHGCLLPCDPGTRRSYRSDSEKEFGHSDECGNLSNPEKKHPFDDLCLDVCPILLGHEEARWWKMWRMSKALGDPQISQMAQIWKGGRR
jgi:hypothetical protein